jgi:3-deoxy-D-manno-octulosonate 8-phosphate phosphatase (KDO 8-P phosphatase)
MRRIRAIALDFDGVLTDGALWWGPGGEEWKRLGFRDVMGLSLARQAGLIVALISGESSPLIDLFAEKMGITDVEKSSRDKAHALEAFALRHGLPLDSICFMGDDVNDLGALAIAGLAAAPADAHEAVLREADLVTRHRGGEGAVREVVDLLLRQEAEKAS